MERAKEAAVAARVPLAVFGEAVFHRSTGEFQPHEAELADGRRLSRCVVWGNVARVFRGKRFCAVTLDDFTGVMDVLAFEERAGLLENLGPGEVVRVLARVRQGREGLYLLADGVQRLSFGEEMLARAENALAARAAAAREKSGKRGKGTGARTKEVKRALEEDFVSADALKVERKHLAE